MERLEELEQKVEDAIINYIKEGGRQEKILDLMKRMEQINKQIINKSSLISWIY